MIQSMNSKITNDTWDEEDLGETTDSNIFCVTRKTKIEEKRNIKLMKIYIGFLTLFFMRMLGTILHLSFLKVSIPGESFHKF